VHLNLKLLVKIASVEIEAIKDKINSVGRSSDNIGEIRAIG
jgi:hypothetical protein